MDNKRKNFVLTGLAIAALGLTGTAQAIDFTGVPYVTYGDGNSYSLPISQELDECTGPGCEFYVQSSPGAIKDLIVVATGANGGPVNTNPDGMDKAYGTPNSSGVNYYETADSGNDPGLSGGSVTTEYSTAWDAEISALNDFRAGEDLIFYFNNNQVNSGATALQNLAVWAQVWITLDGVIVGDVYELANRYSGAANNDTQGEYNIISSGLSGGILNGDPTSYTSAATGIDGGGVQYAPDAGDNSGTDYVLSGGQICIVTAGPLTGTPLPCDTDVTTLPPGSELSGAINHNLGANEAAYAVIFPELNAFINTLDDSMGYTLHIDFRLGCDPTTAGSSGGDENSDVCAGSGTAPDTFGRNINNGYEQIFIGTASTTVNMPLPGTLLLLGAGLLGFGALRFRKA